MSLCTLTCLKLSRYWLKYPPNNDWEDRHQPKGTHWSQQHLIHERWIVSYDLWYWISINWKTSHKKNFHHTRLIRSEISFSPDLLREPEELSIGECKFFFGRWWVSIFGTSWNDGHTIWGQRLSTKSAGAFKDFSYDKYNWIRVYSNFKAWKTKGTARKHQWNSETRQTKPVFLKFGEFLSSTSIFEL